MSSKAQSGPQDKSITVADYSWQFFERVKQRKYGQTEEENSEVAGQNFYVLITKLQETGSKDDVKVPLRVLRDEIGRVYFKSSSKKEAGVVETLFKLYDAVEAACQTVLKSKSEPKELAAANHLLEELRFRFSRLAVGDTWEAYPELKLKALKRMQTYAVRERESKQNAGIPGVGGPPGKPKKTMKRMMSMGGTPSVSTLASWQATIDDLVKAPSARLIPFVKLLLQESVEGIDATQGRLSDGAAADDSPAATSRLPPAPSGIGEAADATPAETGNRLADLNLDDLLGLKDDTPTTSAAESAAGEKAAPASSSDPFAPPQAAPQQSGTPHVPHTPDNHAFQQGANSPFGPTAFSSPAQQQPSSPAVHPPNGSYAAQYAPQSYGQPQAHSYGQPPQPPGYSQHYYGSHQPQDPASPFQQQAAPPFQAQPQQASLGHQQSSQYSGFSQPQSAPSPAPAYGQHLTSQHSGFSQTPGPAYGQHLTSQHSGFGQAPQQPSGFAQQQQQQPQPQLSSQLSGFSQSSYGQVPQQQQQGGFGQVPPSPQHHGGPQPQQGAQRAASQPYSPQSHQAYPPAYLPSPGQVTPASEAGRQGSTGWYSGAGGGTLGSAPSAGLSEHQPYVSSPMARAPSSNPAEPPSYASGALSQAASGLTAYPSSQYGQPKPGGFPPNSPAPAQAPQSPAQAYPQPGQQRPGSAGGGFEQSAFGSPRQPSGTPGSAGKGEPGPPSSNGFDAFGLSDAQQRPHEATQQQQQQQPQQAPALRPQSSISYAGSQPLPPFTDNRFSEVGPVIPPGTHPNIPQPMRAPPAPPSSGPSNQYSAW